MAVDRSSGELYTSEGGNHRVQRFAADGTHLATYGGLAAGDSPGQFTEPLGLAVGPGSELVVADTRNDRLQTRDPGTGTWTVQGGFDRPAAVAVDASGRRYVAEYGADRVRVVGRDGAAVASIGGLSGPEGVAVDAAGNVVVADSGNDRVLRFAPSGDGYQLETTIGGLTQPLGVATDPAGAIYVADTYDNRIKRFDPEQPTTSPAGGAPPAVTPPPAASAPGSGAAPRATRARAPALRLRVSQRRDRRRPYRFLLSGRLLRPAGVAAADGCRGRVELRAGAVRRAIRLRRDCRFRSRLTLPRRTRRGLVRLRATFMGNAVLAPRRARTLRARAG